MLKRRIIPCLDIKNGRTVKGVNFVDIKDAGDPIELAKKYVSEGADELVFLDISATLEERKTISKLVERIAKEINIPFTVGGGISSMGDVKKLITAGADKVSINSMAITNPALINQVAEELGNQCIVIAIDTKLVDEVWEVFSHGGTQSTGKDTVSWATEVADRGAGEILLTSMNNDGTKEGYAIDVLQQVTDVIEIPVIASGGAGSYLHFKELFQLTKATAGLAASIFHYNEIPIPDLKDYLAKADIPVRVINNNGL